MVTAPRASTQTAITGWGAWHPDSIVTNEELCVAFNEYVRRDNARNAEAIAAGTREALRESSAEFIFKASGIRQRYVQDKTGVLDPDRMCPNIPDRPEDQLSVQAEYAVRAAERALACAGKVGEQVDLVVLSASNLQRLYPSISIEVQAAIGARGYGFDMALGCSAATAALQAASQAVQTGAATCALVVVPELTTGHMNWCDRDSHFIFGDGAVAIVIEAVDQARPGAFEILSMKAMSKFSSNIRNNGGYLDRCDPSTQGSPSKLFHQQGRRVFKDVVPMASKFIADHVSSAGLDPAAIDRYWLHQANESMVGLIGERLLGHAGSPTEIPLILSEWGNTASAGSVIAFALHNADLPAGSHGVIASFGAGYSLGSLLVKRL
ncbi:MAG: beta-ketoacyl-ACP synthase III [Kofleriaceae bacterium]|jgi:beta-ketodecanoyl-[acyl-carrier-protein] synthase|nr:beta-ketoacyl-ACP synthase III [Kofleriaceae bacterium]MBP6841252.1 beta-ketoacyl-ACP synthase III [Kofleriaceae bacterium]MBP9203853.1 beta-ketoacyl-ACP synthase III [Kofleriaceae bacterium]